MEKTSNSGANIVIGILILALILVMVFGSNSLNLRNNEIKASASQSVALKSIIRDLATTQTTQIRGDINYLLSNDKILSEAEIEDIKDYIKNIIEVKEANRKYLEGANNEQLNNNDSILDNYEQKALSRLSDIFKESGERFEKLNNIMSGKRLECKLNYLDKADNLIKLESHKTEIMIEASMLMQRYNICLQAINEMQ